MSERQVPVRFLSGPAGSGKTFRCLEEARQVLRAEADGLPLLFLAPKQATFQLERQLLAEAEVPGYTRLHILSFERLAELVLRCCGIPLRPLLTDEGRVMVLRALLMRERSALSVFRGAARLPGFARQLGEVAREFEHHSLTPTRLRQLAAQTIGRSSLRGKLLDLARMGELYHEWLASRHLEDASRLLGLAQEVLEPPEAKERADAATAPSSAPAAGDALASTGSVGSLADVPSAAPRRLVPAKPWFGSLWLDGFAEMTPAELDLAAAVIPRCERATLAFCLERPIQDTSDWLSPWSIVGRTRAALSERLALYDGLVLSNECLGSTPVTPRFREQPALGHLERFWVSPKPWRVSLACRPGSTTANPRRGELRDALSRDSFGPRMGPRGARSSESAGSCEEVEAGSEALPIRLVRCPNPEAEAVTAARAIRRFVRESQGRYREAAVLVRCLDDYQAVIRRVFARYEVPIFLDRRETVAHHPLAELIRSTLRLVANGWRTEDWMSVLKTGLAGGQPEAVDALENAALAAGWEGETWHNPLPCPPDLREAARLESVRCALAPPFIGLNRRLRAGRGALTGVELADALRRLWTDLDVPATLRAWSEAPPEVVVSALAPAAGSMHLTVWQDLNTLLKNLALAFKDEAMSLREWLPILEAGLADLTVGVVPPALDQVLVGAIDRSRNPDLRLVALLGWNDGVFPAPHPAPPLLTESERHELELNGVVLGPDRRRRVGRERYYAYIACTRARERLVVTFAERGAKDRPLNPSPYVRVLRRLFPSLVEETSVDRPCWSEIEHPNEAVVPWLRLRGPGGGAKPVGCERPRCEQARALDRLSVSWATDLDAALPATLADQLYGPGVLRTSVGRLEEFAACPFRWFVHSGLRAEERRLFEVDARQTGSFQHEVLARFHAEVVEEGKRWRDLTPSAARERVARIAENLVEDFANGLFRVDAQRRFSARSLSRSLQDFVEVTVEWIRQGYGFDPAGAEVVFGASGCELPGWEVDLAQGQRLRLQGKIDRVDLAQVADEEGALCVVIDYKSSVRKIDPLLLYHGIQIQLPTYLTVLRQLGQERRLFGMSRLAPVGMFYANLRGGWQRESTRLEAAANRRAARHESFCHRGRFNLDRIHVLDQLAGQPENSGQFRYAPSGKLNRQYQDPLPAPEFAALLDRVERTVRDLGRQVLDGTARVAPFLKGTSDTACRNCPYPSVCRFDPWLHTYRRLQPPPKAASS